MKAHWSKVNRDKTIGRQIVCQFGGEQRKKKNRKVSLYKEKRHPLTFFSYS